MNSYIIYQIYKILCTVLTSLFPSSLKTTYEVVGKTLGCITHFGKKLGQFSSKKILANQNVPFDTLYQGCICELKLLGGKS